MFRTFLAEPIYNLLVWLYGIFPWSDIGIAIILLTIIIKIILWPLTGKALHGQKAMQALQPKVEAVKREFADDKQKMSKELMALYKNEKVNPAASCLPLLIQLPILFALYRVLLVGLNNEDVYQLYPFVQNPGTINEMFLGFINLAKPNIVLAACAGVAQYFQAKMMNLSRPPTAVAGKSGAKDENMMVAMNRSMLYVMPAMTVVIGSSLPGGLALYWLVVTLLSVLQQYMVFHRDPSVK